MTPEECVMFFRKECDDYLIKTRNGYIKNLRDIEVKREASCWWMGDDRIGVDKW